MFTPKPAKTMGPCSGKVDAFVLLLGMVSPHGPPFSKFTESPSDGIDWIVTHIGQGGMVDDWWQSAPGKIANFEMRILGGGDLPDYNNWMC